jgi:hypothetical protein
MEFLNYTPFAPMMFESLDVDDNSFQVVILRGTFNLMPNAPLRPAPDQEPLITSDEFYDHPNASSVRFESDLVPYKPNSDIIINATAYAPGGKALPSWIVSAQIGRKQKSLLVTGPRYWKHYLVSGWQVGAPEPCTEVPIRYEHAYGGQWQHDEESGVCEENPVGIGYANKKYLDKSRLLPAPRLMSPDDLILELGKQHKPEGFSAIAKSWLPRRKYGGTYDEQWLQQRRPKLPKDFDCAYYNCAHPDLVYDGYLNGDEAVALKHLHPQQQILKFSLPAYRVGAVITDKDDYRYGALGNLDTVYMDIEKMQVYLTWRITLPLYQDGIKRLEAKMEERGITAKGKPEQTAARFPGRHGKYIG